MDSDAELVCRVKHTREQFQVAAGVKPGLDLGDDGAAVFIDDLERQPVGIEQRADVLAGLHPDLRNVAGFVDAVGDLLQLPEIKRLKLRRAVLRRQPECIKKLGLPVMWNGVAASGCVQSSNSCPALSHRISSVVPPALRLVGARFSISAMMRCVSAGLVWVM